MKVVIIGQHNENTKLALELLKSKCDLPVVVSSFMEKEEINFKEFDLIIDNTPKEQINYLDKSISKELKEKYRKNNTYGSKYHK